MVDSNLYPTGRGYGPCPAKQSCVRDYDSSNGGRYDTICCALPSRRPCTLLPARCSDPISCTRPRMVLNLARLPSTH